MPTLTDPRLACTLMTIRPVKEKQSLYVMPEISGISKDE
jgi:hypothetical protein